MIVGCTPKSGASWIRSVCDVEVVVLSPDTESVDILVVRHPYSVVRSLYSTPLYAETSNLHPDLPSYGYDWIWRPHDRFALLCAYWEFLVERALTTCKKWYKIEDISRNYPTFCHFCEDLGITPDRERFDKYFAVKTNRSLKYFLPAPCCAPSDYATTCKKVCRSMEKFGYMI